MSQSFSLTHKHTHTHTHIILRRMPYDETLRTGLCRPSHNLKYLKNMKLMKYFLWRFYKEPTDSVRNGYSLFK